MSEKGDVQKYNGLLIAKQRERGKGEWVGDNKKLYGKIETL